MSPVSKQNFSGIKVCLVYSHMFLQQINVWSITFTFSESASVKYE